MANITGELRFRGFEVAETTVRRQLRALGYSLQANRKSNDKNQGRELAPTGTPIHVNTHDFKDAGLGKAIPYGIYDVGRDEGCVSGGISADTAQFAVGSIEAWWRSLGRKLSIDWRASHWSAARPASTSLPRPGRARGSRSMRLDPDTYATRIYVAEEEMDALRIDGDGFHPQWNYTITPRG